MSKKTNSSNIDFESLSQSMRRIKKHIESNEFHNNILKEIEDNDNKLLEDIKFFETKEFYKIFNKIKNMEKDYLSDIKFGYDAGLIFNEDINSECLLASDFYKIHDSVCAVKQDELITNKDKMLKGYPYLRIKVVYRGLDFGRNEGHTPIRYIRKTKNFKQIMLQEKLGKFL